MLPVQWMQETESAYTRHNYTRYFVDLDGSRFTMRRQRRRHLHAYTLTVMGGSEITVHLDERERVISLPPITVNV